MARCGGWHEHPTATTQGDAGAGRLLGVRAAARALGLNPSTVSRYLKDHPELTRGSDTRPLVALNELRQHRSDNTNPARRRSHAVTPGDHVGRLLDANGPASGNGHDVAPPAYTAAKAARESVLAYRARLDLDEKVATLCVRGEIEEATAAAVQALRRRLSDLAPRLAEEIAALGEPREIQARMEFQFRALLKRYAGELAGWE